MKDPYTILGVPPTATDDEVKTAYRNLARKYHPDKYRDSELAEVAGEKMKEINAAYDEVQKLRAGKSAYGGGAPYGSGTAYGSSTYGSGTAYGSSAYGSGTADPGWAHHSGDPYVTARHLINLRRFREAEEVLATVPEAEHNAEWHFLMGCVAVGRGFFVDAQQYFDTACAMDPTNAEYRDTQDRLKNSTSRFGAASPSHTSSCSFCDLCTAFLCADCCCDFGRTCC